MGWKYKRKSSGSMKAAHAFKPKSNDCRFARPSLSIRIQPESIDWVITLFSPASLPGHSTIKGCGSFWTNPQQGRLLHTGNAEYPNSACVLGESRPTTLIPPACPKRAVLPAGRSPPFPDLSPQGVGSSPSVTTHSGRLAHRRYRLGCAS